VISALGGVDASAHKIEKAQHPAARQIPMTANAILDQLKPLGRDGYKNILLKHGATEPIYGVKIEELKKIQKRIKKDYQLALDLYDTGVYDAMYLAGLIADDAQMTKKDLQRWAKKACAPLVGCTVAWVASGSPHAWEIGREWIDSKKERIAAAGWATLGSFVAITDDADLDVAELKKLLQRVQQNIHEAPDAVRNQMNRFVIAVGCYVKALTEFAKQVGAKIGPITVDMGETDCKMPFAPEYIAKVQKRGTIGKKRASAKC
jgi:3-methyladenine DNA glycosylase AlkD